jgi:multiple sugar transport system substrate-binding protein
MPSSFCAMKQLLLFAMIVLLSACSTADSTPVPAVTATPLPTPPPTAVPVTLQLWTVLPDKGVNEQNLNDLIMLFHQENPLINISVSSQPTYTDLYRKVVASIAAGTLPDLVTGLDADLLQYARLKALSPLDDLVNDAGVGLGPPDLADIPPGMLDTMRLAGQDGKIYSLPFARGALALFYNWGAMKAIGITNTPKNWDEFRLHAKSLTKNPVRGFAYRSEAAVFDAMLLSRGGSFFSADLGKAMFNAAPGVDALVYLGEGIKDGWIYRAEGNSDMTDFVAGRTIFNVASTAAIPTYQNAINDAAKKGSKDFEWGVTLLPLADPGKPSALLVGSNIGLLKGSAVKQQAAWTFLRWLMRDNTSALWTEAAGVLPVRLAAGTQLAGLFLKAPQQKQAFQELLPVAHAEANIRSAADVRDLVEGALAAFETGKAAPKAALDDAAAKATILLLNDKK